MTNDLDEPWEDWARDRWIKVSDAICKYRFEVMESLVQMPADQRRRCTPVAAEFLSLLDGTDESSFLKMLRAWQDNNSSEFRRTTLESLQRDPTPCNRWGKM